MQTLGMGSDYRPGYEKVAAADRERAANFCAHTLIGDPEAEAVVEELFDLGDSEAYRLIKAAMDEDDKGLSTTTTLFPERRPTLPDQPANCC